MPCAQPLSLAILTIEPDCASTRRLVAAAKARGHHVDLINTMDCSLHVEGSTLSIEHGGARLPRYDAIIPRIGAAMTSHGCAVVRQLEAIGVPCLASADAILSSRDKRQAHQLFCAAGIPTPKTSFFCVPRDIQDVLTSSGPLPLVIKPLQSSQGYGVEKVETTEDLHRIVDLYIRQQKDFLVQTFIDEAGGRDLRCVVLGDRVVAAITRTAAPGDFRSNLHQGGHAQAAKVSDRERALAQRAASAVGLSFAGVDILRGRDGPVVLEVNSSPGLEGIERATAFDLADQVIRHVESKIAPRACAGTAA